MQYPTPQFIEEEGKIIFFLTFRQFFLLVGGGAVSFFLFYTVPFWLFVWLAIPIMLSVGAIAFIKIDNETIIKVFLHYLGFSFGQKNYVWKKKELSYPLGISDIRKSKVMETKKMIETKR